MKKLERKGYLRKIVIVAIVVLIVLVGCLDIIQSLNHGEKTSLSRDEFISELESGKDIKLMKNYYTLFVKDYDVVVDGNIIGTVSGKFFKFTGDYFTMKSSNGDVIMSEDEEILHLNRQAQFFDGNGNKTIRYESKLISILDTCYFKQDGDSIATYRDVFSIPKKGKITENGEDTWKINKTFWFDNYTIKNVNSSKISNAEVVMAISINDAVSSSGKSSSSSNSSSSK